MQALACKLWLCSKPGVADNLTEEAYDRLTEIKRQAQEAGLYVVRGSKEESLDYGLTDPLVVY